MKKILVCVLLFSNFSLYASEDCYKKVKVREYRKKLSANMLFPKITSTEKVTRIFITCKMYNKSTVGDMFYLPEIVKKFNEERLFGFIPYGTMNKVTYRLLEK